MDFCVYLTYDCEQDSVLEGRPFNKEHREPELLWRYWYQYHDEKNNADGDDIDINIMMKK